LIEVVRNGELFFSRRLGLQGHMIEADTRDSQQMMDDLALEVQRSLDYFESQYGQGSADHVRLVGASEAVNTGFMNKAASYLTVPVRTLEEDGRLQVAEAIDRQAVSRYALAVGGSLRSLVLAA
jgi:MSHA biogenesis protein MshI